MTAMKTHFQYQTKPSLTELRDRMRDAFDAGLIVSWTLTGNDDAGWRLEIATKNRSER